MRAKVTSPDGKQHLMSADNEEALHHAIQQMHGGGKSLSSTPHPGLNGDMSGPKTIDVASLDKKPKAKPRAVRAALQLDGIKMNVAVSVDQVPDILDVLERIANRPEPELPPPPEPPEKVDFAPVIAAIKRLERDEPAPVDLTPMHAHADEMRRQMDSLVAAVESQSESMDSLRTDLLAALERVCAAVSAPRELVRDGKSMRSEVVT